MRRNVKIITFFSSCTQSRVLPRPAFRITERFSLFVVSFYETNEWKTRCRCCVPFGNLGYLFLSPIFAFDFYSIDRIFGQKPLTVKLERVFQNSGKEEKKFFFFLYIYINTFVSNFEFDFFFNSKSSIGRKRHEMSFFSEISRKGKRNLGSLQF